MYVDMDNSQLCDPHVNLKDNINDDEHESVNEENKLAPFEIDENLQSDFIIAHYGSSLPFLLNRALYPVDMAYDTTEFSPISSLFLLCSKEIIKDVDFLEKVYPFLPSNRYELFMKTAICNDFRNSAEFLLSKWTLQSITTSVLDSNTLLRYAAWKVDVSFVLATRIMLLCGLFFDFIINNNSESTLSVLDLRGVPIDDRMMNYLICKILHTSRDLKLANNYQIIVDCEISSAKTQNLLNSLLDMKERSSEAVNPCLQINSIDVMRLDEPKCWILLNQLNPKDLTGLRINSDFTSDFYDFFFSKLSSLTTLDMPSPPNTNSRKLPLHLILKLRRLGLIVGYSILSETIPLSILRRLHYLSLGGRRFKYMINDDFEYMMSSPLSLVELDLSRHVIMEDHLSRWRIFMLSLAPSLKVLVLNECLTSDCVLPSLVNFILPLTKLRYLSLGENWLSLSLLRRNLGVLKKMPNVKGLRVDFLNNCGKVITVDVDGDKFFEVLQQGVVSGNSIPVKIRKVEKTPWD